MAHEILKLKPVANPGPDIDYPALQCSALSLFPSHTALGPGCMGG